MEAATAISVDEFQALEQKVLRAVELIRSEREARAVAESDAITAKSEAAAAKAEAAELREQLAAAGTAHTEVEAMTREREAVRLRVEKMLAQMDELL